MRRVLIALVSLLALALPVSAADLADRLSRPVRLEGVGWQNDGSHWSIDVILSAAGGQIAYPSLDCAGEWTRTGQGLSTFVYTERILHNTEACVEYGQVAISALDGGGFHYEWREGNGGAVIARAVLFEVGSARRPYMDLLLETLHMVDLDFLLPDYFR
jgi:hypothetical protein